MPAGEYDGKTWVGYFTYGEKIAGVFGSGTVKRTGYDFGGWYCGSTMLWDSNGNVQKDVWIDGKQWSDKSGNYMWKGNTEVWARWIPKLTYGLTLVYNGATTRGGSDGEIATYNNYFILDGGSPGRKLPGVYGKYRVKKTGYYFKGWYCGDVMLWDENGEPVLNAYVGGKQWSTSGRRYVWDGSTTVTAHWEPMKTSLTLVEAVYDEYKIYGAMPICLLFDHSKSKFTSDEKKVVDWVIEKCRELNPWDLVRKTHQKGTPWDTTVEKSGLESEIDLQTIRKWALQ